MGMCVTKLRDVQMGKEWKITKLMTLNSQKQKTGGE